MSHVHHAVSATRFASRRNLSVLRILERLIGIARQRRHLSRLDDAALRDVGLTKSEANAEANRGFWDAPSNWRQ